MSLKAKKPNYYQKNPTVYLTPDAKMKLDLYIALAEGEISGLGEVIVVNKTDLLVTDIYLLKQKCTPSETVLDQMDISDLILSLISTGGSPGKLKLWWHSHADMDVFWSVQTDEKTIHGFRNEWMLSIVGNKAGRYLARLDFYDPIRATIDNLNVSILQEPDQELENILALEIQEKVIFSVPEAKQPVMYDHQPDRTNRKKIRRRGR